MARNKATQPNIDGSDPANFPDKRIRNNDGSGNGTPVNEQVYGDMHEFHAKIMRDAKEPYNGLPDNNSNGYQLYDSLMSLAGKNDLVKDLTSTATTLSVPFKVSALKNEEAITFKSTFDSVNTINLVSGTDGSFKPLTILGTWKNGQFVRLINYQNVVTAVGLYDSQIVPNLAQTIETITNTFDSLTKIISVFQVGGGMILWNKPVNIIPNGWREVENWRGRIPVGLDETQNEFNILGKTGGTKTHILTLNEMPAHNHNYEDIANNSAGGSPGPEGGYDGGNNRFHSRNLTTSSKGGNEAHNNLPPYRVALFIEYVG
jgi:hypothetical protein